jgi:hypothetical protein
MDQDAIVWTVRCQKCIGFPTYHFYRVDRAMLFVEFMLAAGHSPVANEETCGEVLRRLQEQDQDLAEWRTFISHLPQPLPLVFRSATPTLEKKDGEYLIHLFFHDDLLYEVAHSREDEVKAEVKARLGEKFAIRLAVDLHRSAWTVHSTLHGWEPEAAS